MHRSPRRPRRRWRIPTAASRCGRTAKASTCCGRELAAALDLPTDSVVVRHVEGAGCYGHNGADDVAMDAALLARSLPGRPVHVVWSRSDEMAWAPLGPAGVVEVGADCAYDGGVVSWRHEIWSGSYMGRPGTTPTTALLAASHRSGGEPIRAGGEPPLEHGGGAGRNAVPGYDFPAHRVTNHLLTEMPLRTSALRSLGAYLNVFAAESFMDELAMAAGRDPLEFRLAHLSDPRGRSVLLAAAARAGWAQRTSSRVGWAWHRLCAVQELVGLLRGGRRGGGDHRGPGTPAGHRRGCGSGDQPRRRSQPDRGRRHPSHQLDAQGAGALRPVERHQRHLGNLPDPAVLRSARD